MSLTDIVSSILPDRIIEPQPGDLIDLGKRGGDFLFARVGQTFRERGENRVFAILSCTDDERKAESLAVGGVVFFESSHFVASQRVQPRGGLFAGGFAGQRAFSRQLAD